MDGIEDDGGRLIEVMRIHGSGTLPGLLKVIREQLMAGNGVAFDSNSFDVVNQICAVADQMGAEPQLRFDAKFELEGVTVYPARELSTAKH